MRVLKDRLKRYDDYHTDVIVSVDESIIRSKSEQFRRAQGMAKSFGLPNTRDHSNCAHHDNGRLIMPRIAETKVGSRNREKSASVVDFLFDWDELLDTEGDYFAPMVKTGLILEEGEDYQILDSDGNTKVLKTGHNKVGKRIAAELAKSLNVRTSVRVPKKDEPGGWVSFRPRMDTPFSDEQARDEYIEKNGG